MENWRSVLQRVLGIRDNVFGRPVCDRSTRTTASHNFLFLAELQRIFEGQQVRTVRCDAIFLIKDTGYDLEVQGEVGWDEVYEISEVGKYTN